MQHQFPSALDLRRLECGGGFWVPARDPSVSVSDNYAAVQLNSQTNALIYYYYFLEKGKFTQQNAGLGGRQSWRFDSILT